MTIALDQDGIVTHTVTLKALCEIEQISRNTAYLLIRQGVLPVHRKNPTERRSPYLVSPAEHRAYQRNVTA